MGEVLELTAAANKAALLTNTVQEVGSFTQRQLKLNLKLSKAAKL